MRLLKRRKSRAGDAARAITQATSAGEEAIERLTTATSVRAGADLQAAHEKRTIVSDLRAMRERNHLAEMILESVRRGGKP